jgi:hypothetical protein
MGRDVIEIFTFLGSIALISMLVYRYQGTTAIIKQVGDTYSGLLATATFQNPVSNPWG